MIRCNAILRPTLALLVTVLAGPALALDVLLPYQARLLDGQGSPVNQVVDVEFRLYTSVGGAGAFYTEVQTVAVSQGLLIAVIGSETPVAPGLFDDKPEVWLGVTIKDDPGSTEGELVPRLRIGTHLFADRANSADDVPGKDITPNSITVNGQAVVDVTGSWVGPAGPVGFTPVAFKADYGGNDNQSVPNNTPFTLVLDNEEFDTANAYDTSTGVFTAPADGIYSFTVHATLEDPNQSNTLFQARIFRNAIGVAESFTHDGTSQAGFHLGTEVSTLLQLTTGDTVTFDVYRSSDPADSDTLFGGITLTWVTGHRIS